MTERPPFDTSEASLFAALERPNPIRDFNETAHQKEAELSSFKGTDEQRDQFAQRVAAELTGQCAHFGREVHITGACRVSTYSLQGIDLRSLTISRDQIETSTVFLDEFTAITIGYSLRAEATRTGLKWQIFQVVKSPVEPILTVDGMGSLYRDHLIYIPVDGSVDVSPAELHSDEIHIAALQAYAATLTHSIDTAVNGADSPSETLQRLSEVTAEQTSGVVLDHELSHELFKYLMSAAGIKEGASYSVSGVDTVFIGTDLAADSSVASAKAEAVSLPPDTTFDMDVHGFSFVQPEKDSQKTGDASGDWALALEGVALVRSKTPPFDDVEKVVYALLTPTMTIQPRQSIQQ